MVRKLFSSDSMSAASICEIPVSGSSWAGVAAPDRVKLSSVIDSSGGIAVDKFSWSSSILVSVLSGGLISGGGGWELPMAVAFISSVLPVALPWGISCRLSASSCWPYCANRFLKVWMPRAYSSHTDFPRSFWLLCKLRYLHRDSRVARDLGTDRQSPSVWFPRRRGYCGLQVFE